MFDWQPPLGSERAKVLAVRLPMVTIKSFMLWLQEGNPSTQIGDFDIDSLLYQYYKIDTAKLAAELSESKNPTE